jgi:hypothetical protein
LTIVLRRAALAHRAGAGIERHLVRRAIHHGRVVPENVLAAVAVMHVEIDDRDAFRAVPFLRVARRDRDIVEQAEAHRRRGLGMMAGRAHRDERVCDSALHHLIDRLHRAARTAQRRLEAARRHRGVGIEPHHAFARRGVAHLLDVIHRMRQCDRFERGHRRLLARERLEFFMLERVLDRAQAIGPLGMSHRHQVIETGGMAEQQGGHAVEI